MTSSVVRVIAMAACAGLALVEQVRLGWRSQGNHRALAIAVPGLGAVDAWKRGERVGPLALVVAVIGYLALRFA